MKAFIAVWKDLVAVMRDTTLLLVAVLLIVFPETLNNILIKAGVEEGSFVGLKWKRGLVASDAALKEARAAISDLQKKNDELSKLLGKANTSPQDPVIKAEITKLNAENKLFSANAVQVQTAVTKTIAANAALVDRELSASNSTRWGIIWSGDATLAGAQYEVQTVAKQRGLPNPAIYLRQGSYRSISVVDTKEQADQYLPKARERRQDAYIVPLNTWCPAPDQRDGFLECKHP